MPTITLHLNIKNYLSVLAGVCVVILAAIPLWVSATHLIWIRWQVIIWSAAVVAVVALFVQAILQSKEDTLRSQRERERDERAAVTLDLLKRIAEKDGLLEAEHPTISKTRSKAFDSAPNIPDTPRLYPTMDVVQRGFVPHTTLVVTNHGREVAHKIRARADLPNVAFGTIEIVAPGEKKSIEITLENSSVIFKHGLNSYLMKLWDAKGEISSEFPIPMRIFYEDCNGNKFETVFDLIYLPIHDILNRNQLFETRNIEFKRPTQPVAQ